jgi:hypothetical protein
MASPERPLIARMTISHFRRCPTAHPDMPPLPTQRQPDIVHPPTTTLPDGRDHIPRMHLSTFRAAVCQDHPSRPTVMMPRRRREPRIIPRPHPMFTRPGGEGCGPSAHTRC